MLKPRESQQMTVTANMSDDTTEDVRGSGTGATHKKATVCEEDLIAIPKNACTGTVEVRAYNGKNMKI